MLRSCFLLFLSYYISTNVISSATSEIPPNLLIINFKETLKLSTIKFLFIIFLFIFIPDSRIQTQLLIFASILVRGKQKMLFFVFEYKSFILPKYHLYINYVFPGVFSLTVYGETVLTLHYVPHELIYLIFTYLSIDLKKKSFFKETACIVTQCHMKKFLQMYVSS